MIKWQLIQHLTSLADADLDPNQKHKFLAFLGRNRDIFAKDLSELGQANVPGHRIETDNAQPQRQRFCKCKKNVNRGFNVCILHKLIGFDRRDQWGPCLF